MNEKYIFRSQITIVVRSLILVWLSSFETFVVKQVMPNLQKLLPRTGCHEFVVTNQESTQEQHQEGPCELSDTYDEYFVIELQYMSIASLNDAIPK